MEFGECVYDFDVIDVAERSPLHYQHPDQVLEEGLKTSKSWCGPLNQLIGMLFQNMRFSNTVVSFFILRLKILRNILKKKRFFFFSKAPS